MAHKLQNVYNSNTGTLWSLNGNEVKIHSLNTTLVKLPTPKFPFAERTKVVITGTNCQYWIENTLQTPTPTQ
jgi:hypothetical protein